MWDQRRNEILEIVNNKGYVTSIELSEMLHKSLSTIQRDLIDLNERGLLIRIWSGAKSIGRMEKTPYNAAAQVQPVPVQMGSSHEVGQEKVQIDMKIAICAANLVKDDDLIYIDDSFATELMIEHLAGKRIRIISNSWRVISKACSYHLLGTLLGGDLDVANQSFYGMLTLECLGKFKFSKTFLGGGLISNDGIFACSTIETEIKQKAISKSLESFMLVNATRFDKVGYYKLCDLGAAKIVTESAAAQQIEVKDTSDFIFCD